MAFLHPGVYALEIPSGARAIEGVLTSTTIFVGETERGPIGPTKIKSRIEYERLFGGYFRQRALGSPPGTTQPSRLLMPHALDGFFANGGGSAYVLRAMDGWDTAVPAELELDFAVPASGSPPATTTRVAIRASAPGIWGNAIRVAALEATNGDPALFRLVVVMRGTDPADGTDAIVEDLDRLSTNPASDAYVVDALRRSAFIRWAEEEGVAVQRPVPVATGRPTASAIIATHAQALSGGLGGGGAKTPADYQTLLERMLARVDDASLLVAACDSLIDRATTDDLYMQYVDTFAGYAEARPRQDLFFIGDLPSVTGSPTEATEAAVDFSRNGQRNSFTAHYWPHVIASDPVGLGRAPTIVLPPAGFVAGVYARTDGRRGVWKAPAGVEAGLSGTIGLVHALDDTHSDELNPAAVNALRLVPGAGRVIWGTRTTRPESEWRYIPVRRTAIFLRMSIVNGIQWAVFEPNDERLWGSLRATIGGFMDIQFRNGAFAGSTARDAYFVKVDAATTTEDDQVAGIVNILVGFAPLRPAEFVVVRLSQKTQAAA